jgi:hypothetical protein
MQVGRGKDSGELEERVRLVFSPHMEVNTITEAGTASKPHTPHSANTNCSIDQARIRNALKCVLKA